jgi:NitT/TauT family transport system substrate-binding protein
MINPMRTTKMTKTKKSIAATTVLLTTFFLASFSSCQKAPEKKQPFDIGMVTFAGYAPLYLAKEKGFFGDLEVNLKRIEEIPSIRAGMSNGELEAYLATPDIALDTNSKPPGRAVWAIDESAGGDGVVVAGNIHDLAGLKGKKIAAEPGLPPHFVLLYLLYQNGMSSKDVLIQDMTTQNAAAAFTSKAVDAAGIYEPYLSTAEKQRPGSRVVISSKQTPDMIVDLIFAGDNVIASRPADIVTIIAGWRKAMNFIKSNPDEAYAIMAKAFNLSVADFKDTVGGIVWLNLPENQRLFGTDASPGPLYKNFTIVRDVLHANRSDVFQAQPADHLTRSFVQSTAP